MNTVASTLETRSLPWGIRSLLTLLDRIQDGAIALTTPDGEALLLGQGYGPVIAVEITDWAGLRKVFRHGDIGLAEAYRDGHLRTNDLCGLIRLGIINQNLLDKAIHGNPLLNLGYRWRHLFRRNSKAGSRRNIQAHYDLGNDFYQLWLDSSMTYSSARFEHGETTDMLKAQDAKYQRMIDLCGAQTGDTVLEIGCGWGGFAEYAARKGIYVHGVTLSPNQLEYAQRRMEACGFQDLVTLELRDYRDITGQYNHVVSVEMLEAVGEQYWPMYFDRINRFLKPGGRAAIQSIVINDAYFDQYRSGTDFIQQYIFPGGMLPSPNKIHELSEQHQLQLGIFENFGLDYAETLRRWSHRFEARLEQVRALGYDQAFIQLWRFYLAYCEAGFDENRIDVVQFQLSKPAK